MANRRVSISEAKARLSTLVNQVAYSRERVILQSHGRPKAALIGLDDLYALQAGGGTARLAEIRADGLGRIETLGRRIRRAAAGRARRDVSAELAALRTVRDARLARLR